MENPQNPQQTPREDEPPRFLLHVLSTAKQEKGKRLENLLVALNELKFLAQEELGWNRISLCSSLTGVPTRILELYELVGFDAVARSLKSFEEKDDPVHRVLERVWECCETREVELLRQMPYSPRPFPSTTENPRHHFLHTVLTVKATPLEQAARLEQPAPLEEDPFTTQFRLVLPTFESIQQQQPGRQVPLMTLMAAGRSLFGRFPPFRVMNLWRFDSANTLNQVMQDLAHDPNYLWFLENTLQSQDLLHGFPGSD